MLSRALKGAALCGALMMSATLCLAGDPLPTTSPETDPVMTTPDDPIVEPEICVQLTVDNLVGGSVATFQVAGGPPGASTAVLYSLSLGSFSGSTGPWCYDFGLTIPPPPASNIVVIGTFNSVGIFQDTYFIPPFASGWLVHFQAAVSGTCPDTCMSNIHSEVVG